MNDELKKEKSDAKKPQKGGKRLAHSAPTPTKVREKSEHTTPGRTAVREKTEQNSLLAAAKVWVVKTGHRIVAAFLSLLAAGSTVGKAAIAKASVWIAALRTVKPTAGTIQPMERAEAIQPAETPESGAFFSDSPKRSAAQTPRAARQVIGERVTALLIKVRRIPRRWRHIVREKRAKHFPESERLLIQVLLFAWGMFPMLGSSLREITWSHRKRTIHQFAKVRTWMEGQNARPAAFLGLSVTLAAVALFFSMYTFGTTVTYDGTAVAAVDSKAAAEDARNNLEQVTAQTLGATYTIDESLLHYASGLLRRQDVVAAEVLEEDLSQEIGLVTSAYCLYVEGELIGATAYEGALEELLLQLKNGITDENTISCDFAENVEIRQEYVSTDKIMNLGYLAEMLYSTKTAEITYTVVQGDVWSKIANSHDLTSAELLALNPGYNINKLSIGEVLTMSASVPYLTMTVVQRERYVADLPFDIEYTDSANLFKGDYKVTSAGDYGAADMVAKVTYVNGEEMDRTILSSVTLHEPITEQRLRGTKERPSWMATGTFRWPTTGRITSRYGYRNLSYSYASTNHKGIDIGGRRGNPIYAADGGTVVYAGWMSGYGYLVQIDHGNGYVTYYGHNSSLVVSVGQHVYKGQQVAKMGSTGNSTGNHCHFEVRYHGVPKNPLNYL